ncbi:MAG: DUF4114 domain-containing protein [Myxococcales bacterium]|jgi:hypothetical protein
MTLHRALVTTAVLALAADAFALSQPDGTVIPAGAGLQSLFDARGEAIDALRDAAIMPQTFVPGCDLNFEVIARNAGYKNSFGWYNATGSKPELSDLNEFLKCDDPVGTVRTLSIRSDPRYAGGEVGFYQAVGSCGTVSDHLYIFYSEPRFNPDAQIENPFIHLLIYNSTAVPRAFYFGWEDLISGGDNDFDDLTTFVTGITCSGGGGACDTELEGVCASGTLQCQSGELACVQHVQPSPETCDGLDNDCSGVVDDGAECPSGHVCDLGACVRRCAGELGCPQGRVCSVHGVCVERACAEVECPAGTRCVGGECKGPCDGVVCPHGQSCRAGACVDPCLGLECDQGQVCVEGLCTDRCQCTGCPSGQSCGADGRCGIDACAGSNCPPGTWCDQTGACRDACEGAVCPAGQVCVAGLCEDAPEQPDGGTGSDAAGSDAGSDAGLPGLEDDAGAVGADGGVRSDGGSQGEAAVVGGSCGCPAAGAGAVPAPFLLIAGLGAFTVLGRRRRG